MINWKKSCGPKLAMNKSAISSINNYLESIVDNYYGDQFMKILASALIALIIIFASCTDLFAAEPNKSRDTIHQIKIYETKKTMKKDTQYWNLLWSPKARVSPGTNIFDKPKNDIAFDDNFTKC